MIKRIWRIITQVGIDAELDSRETRRISYVNYLTLVGILYIMIRIIVSIPNGSYCLKLFSLAFLAVPVLILNYHHFYTVAKIWAFTLWVSGISFFTYFYLGGFHGAAFFVLFSAVPWPFMLFDTSQKKHIFACLGYLFICFALLIILHYVYPLPVTVLANQEVVRISLTVLTIIFLLFLTWYFHSSNVAVEEKLRREKDKSDAANRAKSIFLANMSHELRTPLNAILGFSELMRRDPETTSKQLDNLSTIGRSGEHLLSLINDVLEFSKIEAGRIVLHQENFNLHQLLIGLMEMFRLRAQEKGIYLNLEQGKNIPRIIRTDKNRLYQILINLLGNAVKFTETGGITLGVTNIESGRQRTGKCLLNFEVIDTGIGISQEEQDMIFDAFFQADSQRSFQQGTGLGLPISQKFAALLGGVLRVHSEVGKGTHLTLEIPVEITEGIAVETSLMKRRVIGLAPGQPDFRLLVVEDNDNNRNLLVKLLKTVGFSVQEAGNGQEAIDICETWHPHLIWMDMRMPVMDGYQATSEIKNSSAGKDVVIIALTASAFNKDRLKVLENGGNDFVGKPFREAEIFAMIHKHLGVHYVYEQIGEDHHSPNPWRKISNKSLIVSRDDLPAEIIARLKEAVELSDVNMIDQVIKEIRNKNDQLAEELTELANNFAYDKILTFVQKTNKTITDNH